MVLLGLLGFHLASDRTRTRDQFRRPRLRFLARSSRGSRPPASAPHFPPACALGSSAVAERSDLEVGGSCGDASALLAAEDDMRGAVAAERDICGAVSTQTQKIHGGMKTRLIFFSGGFMYNEQLFQGRNITSVLQQYILVQEQTQQYIRVVPGTSSTYCMYDVASSWYV